VILYRNADFRIARNASRYLADSLGGLILLVAGLWYFWEVGFRRGTVGPNKYGPDPLQM
jgi:uncharacterized membrane protein YhaH (DUF805 family)